MTSLSRFSDLADLRDFVQTTLCERNWLAPMAFQMTEQVLFRRGRPCGMLFILIGPRQVRLTAVWDADSHQLFFYAASGERQSRMRLQQGPRLMSELAHSSTELARSAA